MSKKIFAIVILAVTLLTSARYTTPRDGRVGYEAPTLRLEAGDTSLTMQQFSGQCVLVTFWSSELPESRVMCRNNDMAVRQAGHIVHVAVNMDRSEGLFAQLAAIEELPATHQYHIATDDQQAVADAWRLDTERLGAFLIAPDGKIAAVNPTAEQLRNVSDSAGS